MVTVIDLTTVIQAPMQRVFDLSRHIDLEVDLIAPYGGYAAANRQHGLIEKNECVTWSIRQFGLRVRHTSCITAMETPPQFADWYFQDAMEQGIFRRFWHDHYFTALDANTTKMRDIMHFEVPWYLLGSIAAKSYVRARLTRLLNEKRAAVKQLAESDGWRKSLPG